jgi:broad specificity phosphatase PhoE
MWNKWESNSFMKRLSLISKEKDIIVIIRHAERENILSPSTSHKALLTMEGKANARLFGSRLPTQKSIRIFHSPVERCKQTVDNIVFNIPEDVYENKGVHPYSGCSYIKDSEGFNEAIFKLGGIEFVRQWVGGKIESSIIDPWRKSVVNMLSGLIDLHKAGNGSIDLHVTHDMNILLLMNLIKDLTSNDFEWPYYLEGCIIYHDYDCISVIVRDIEKKDIMRGLVSL